MAYTLQQLSDMIDALTARVNNIDGQGLTDSNLSQLSVINATLAGQNTTLRQSILKMEQLYQDLKTTVVTFTTLLKQHLGIP